jgi:hypothetical protein
MMLHLLLIASLAAPQDVPNATLRQMYEHRAEVARTERSAALLLGGAMLAGGLLTGLFLRSADARTQALGLPWAIEADLLGCATLLAAFATTGREADAQAKNLALGGSTPLHALLVEERRSIEGTGRLLAVTLSMGGAIAALGIGLVVGGGRLTTGTESAAYSSAGAAVLSLGVLIAALGVFIWNEARGIRAQLDRGFVEDLELVRAHDVEADASARR